MIKTRYYLSFDCASKTFAYIFVKLNYIDIVKTKRILQYLDTQVKQCNITEDLITSIQLLDNNIKQVITVISAECIDLFPNIANKDINTVNRIQTMNQYVKKSILPLLSDIDINMITVLIEFQMSYNTQSKVISIGLISLFSDYDVHLVSPMLKNKIYFSENGHYSKFIEKYKNSYDANKKHALYNFKQFEVIFDQVLPISDKLKGHISDAFMQIIGYIKN
jgi:hypothetical protein